MSRFVRPLLLARCCLVVLLGVNGLVAAQVPASHQGTPKNLRRPIDFDELELLSYPIP